MPFEFERDEWRGAVREMTEMQRLTGCGHDYRRGVCVYCGDDEPRKDRR